MNTDISVIFKKYLVAGLIALFGLIMLVVGIRTGQDNLFMTAATNILIGGVLAILFSAGVLKSNTVLGIGIACILVTVYIGYASVKSIQATIAHNEARSKSEELVRYNLSQIRDIQRAHRNTKGRYAANWDELIEFFENGKITIIESEKSVPAKRLSREEVKIIYNDNRAMDRNMDEREAAILASLGNPTNNPDLVGFRRDTVVKSFKEDYLNSISRIKERQKLGINVFRIEDLRYIPMTNPKDEWDIQTRENFPYGNDTIPTIRVEGKEPVPMFEDGKRQVVGFGNLQTNSDKAFWE